MQLYRKFGSYTDIDNIADRLKYAIPMTDLLDDYTQFIYKGQSAILSKARAKSGLNMKEYATAMGYPVSSYNDWENGTVLITRKTWEKYLRK